MADDEAPARVPTLEDLQHWTYVMGRAQQMMMEHFTDRLAGAAPQREGKGKAEWPDPAGAWRGQMELWAQGMAFWQRMLTGEAFDEETRERADRDRRFSAPQWRDNPLFDTIRQSYLLIADKLLGGVDEIEGLDEESREQMRFATGAFVDAMSPANFAFTNPLVIERTLETRGENLLKGLKHMLDDLAKGQLTHTDPEAFEIGRNIATTPGKVVARTPLYELIQYSPTTGEVFEIPLIIFPPWINRFYILDLNPRKSFVRWAVGQGLTVFMLSWKSADDSLAGVTMDDYVRAQREAIETVREALDVEAVNVVGYCVAGTTLAATLAWLAARGEAGKIGSATFLTAQVDFSEAGDLKFFTSDEHLSLIEQLTADSGTLDGRYMAATFNMLRGRDLIWNYVVNNYLMGEDYPLFDLLHWNGDTTNLPAAWHRAYIRELYRENRLVEPGGVEVDGVPIDLGRVETPAYVQAGREDHIAPPQSVWKLTRHFSGPVRFLLAGSGHIAGVVNPPEARKYQYWTCDEPAQSLEEFIDRAQEHPGSWWPDWLEWVAAKSGAKVPAKGARMPGKGKLEAIEDAPGSYVRMR
ncbi:MAG: PHA/PHB synthase family protein [Sphingomonadaceae bacterium]